MRVLRLLGLAVVAALVLVGLGVPTAVAYPCCGIATGEISSTSVVAGTPVTVTVRGTTPGRLTMQILSAPVTIGSGTVGADGTGAVTGDVPPGYSGPHTIHVTGAGGEVFDFAITVEGVVSGGGGGGSGSDGGESGGGGGLASTGAQIALASGVGLAVLLAGVLVLVVARPRRLGSPRP